VADQYIDVPIEFDETALFNQAVVRIQESFPEYDPNIPSLTNITLRSCATMMAVGCEVASTVPFSIFKAFLNWAGQPSLEAVAATVIVRFTAIDDVGHVVPALTPLGMSSQSVQQGVGFQTLNDAQIPPGQTFVDTLAVATVAGSRGNNLNTVFRVDGLGFITNVSLSPSNNSSDGGQDAELDTEFATRGAQELETWTETPILGRDFALLARKINGVYRCGYVDNYNPADGTYDNDKMVALCPIDAQGDDVTQIQSQQVKALMESLREINFVCNMMTTTVTSIDVDVTCHIGDSSINALMQAEGDVTNAVNAFLDKSSWGKSVTQTGEVPVWTSTPVVRYSKVMTVVESVPEVDWAENLTIGVTGSGVMDVVDITMPGVFALPSAGTVNVNVVSP
jgi:hypothetical protein